MWRISKNEAVVAIALLLFWGVVPVTNSREIGTNPIGVNADLWCAGGRIRANTTVLATEACLDALGNVVPTTNNAQALGTSSFKWANIEAVNISTSGASVTMPTGQGSAFIQGTAGTANANGTGNTFGPSGLQVVGSLVLAPTQVGNNGLPGAGIFVSTTIPFLSAYETLTSSATNGGNILITATPSISTLTIAGSVVGQNLVYDGAYLILGSTGPTNGGGIILQDNGTLAGSLLHLGAATRQIGPDKVLTLIFSQRQGFWQEVSYANNN